MTQFTNFGENKIADKFRGVEPTYPTNWYFAYASAADDGTFTEITGPDLPRVAVLRSLAKFAGTQAEGSTIASSGSSHTTSNNDDIQFGAAASNRGTANYVGLFDAGTGGNCWMWAPIEAITINSGDTPKIAAHDLSLRLALVGGTSYLVNKMIDEIFRGQAWAYPASLFARLYTAPANDAGVGTEVAGGSYARAEIESSFAEWFGTGGVTGASSGTDGLISNRNPLAFPAPSANWGSIAGDGQGDASSGGNLLWKNTYGAAKTVSAGGSPPTWAAGQLKIRVA